MKAFLIIVVLVILPSCSPIREAMVQTTSPTPRVVGTTDAMESQSVGDVINTSSNSTLPNLGVAPELTTTVWLNSATPLRLSGLNGKVVLLEMWTFGCINCRNVIPSLKEWHDRYAGKGLVIIGNHFPEFDQERDLQKLTDAVAELGIDYPVTQDNDGRTWKAYDTRFWPTLYLIDKNGHIRYTHIGEGSYKETEIAIQSLLLEK